MLVINPIQLEGSLVVIEPLQPEHEAELQHVGRATRTHNVLFVESVPPIRERYASICVWYGYVRDTVMFSIIDSEWPQVKEKLAIKCNAHRKSTFFFEKPPYFAHFVQS
ncbi:hypothetical protein [Brevibacillus sp. VP]|uniref:hypothetical protein n=1 Tax=unclassified Brevibacillus TaxID=2684853 RepID=UPI001F26E681|nr:hypothetical protein [Brevibacillus sp. VP]